MVDGCLCDERRRLIFLPAWGRGTAIQAFLARLALSPAEDGPDHFHAVNPADAALPVFPGQVDRLEKRATHKFRRTLFGSLVHPWLFGKRPIAPDKASAGASNGRVARRLHAWRDRF